jgi:ketosteroid isomerase-like protein
MTNSLRLVPAAVLIALALVPCPVHAQRPDLQAAAAAIMTADRNFNQAVAEKDRAKFLSFIAENATFVGQDDMHGHDAILKGWDAFFQPEGPTLTWEPTQAEVLVAGDVGYSVGSWIRRSKGPDGRVVEARGQYVTTWKKQPDGSWRVVYDIGSTAPNG